MGLPGGVVMRFTRLTLPALFVMAALTGRAPAAGMLIPEDVKLPPLAMVNHRVTVEIVDQFTMWVSGKEQGGELLDAKHANKVYTDIVRRTQDPGLLEYLGNSLMRLKVFPVPAKGD